MIKVSVIVPVYNVEKYLPKCLDSLVNQTLEDIEILVVNDGSPDNSQGIIDKYAKKYSNIVPLKKENGGQGSARNYALKYAKGEYIGYVDSDDYVESAMFAKLYNLAKQKDLDIAICGSNNINENTNQVVIDIDRRLLNNKNDFIFGRFAVWNKIYKKELLTKNKLEFRSKVWYEDFDFTIKVLSLANKIDYIDEPLYDYLVREGSTMNNSNLEKNFDIIKAFDQIIDLKDKMYDELEFLAIDHILISTSVRIIKCNINRKERNDNLKKLEDYVSNNFKNYRNNKYIKYLAKNRKVVLSLINKKQYWLVDLIFKIKKG